jgi:hypothetical protein
MQIRAAHLRHEGIDSAVFDDADARSHLDSDRAALLDELVLVGRRDLHWRIEKAALAFVEGGRPKFLRDSGPGQIPRRRGAELDAHDHALATPPPHRRPTRNGQVPIFV